MSFTEFGQSESLTTRIRGLIREYPKGIGIIKEFVQNADDAGASRVRMVMDWRTHDPGSVPERMRPLLGPALLIYNDALFTEDDLASVQQIGDSLKRADIQKTGSFGLGINSCYNVTDCPSFITGQGIYFLDPQIRFVPKDSKSPGGAADLKVVWKESPQLLRPFAPIGLAEGQENFEATAFRLPLRSKGMASDSKISSEVFGRSDFEALVKLAVQEGSALMLFLKNVLHFDISELDENGAAAELLSLETQNDSEVRQARNAVQKVVQRGLTPLLELIGDSEARLPVARYVHRLAVSTSATAAIDEWRVVSGIFRDSGSDVIEAMKRGQLREAKSIPWAGVATPAVSNRDAIPVIGRAFCSLPLPQASGLPIHVNGFFHLDSSRREVFADEKTVGAAADRVAWNQCLVRHAVAPAYLMLLEDIAEELATSEFKSLYDLLPRVDKTTGIFGVLTRQVFTLAASRPLIQCVKRSGHRRLAYKKVRHLPSQAQGIFDPLLAHGVALPEPQVPLQVIAGFTAVGFPKDTLDPEAVRGLFRLGINQQSIEDAQASLSRKDWIADLLAYCLSDSPGARMKGVCLGLREDGILEEIVPDRGSLWYGDIGDRDLFVHAPDWLIDEDVVRAAGFGRKVADEQLFAAGFVNLSKLKPAKFLELVVEQCLEGKTYRPTSPDVPNEPWLQKFFHRLSKHWADKGLQPKHLAEIVFIPDQSQKLRKPGKSSPLLPGKGTPEECLRVFETINLPLVSGGDELLESIRQFAGALPGTVRRVNPARVVASVKRLPSGWDEGLELAHAKALLNYLASSVTWLNKPATDWSHLRDLRLFPTVGGNLVRLTDDGVFLPEWDNIPSTANTLKLLSLGPSGRWGLMLERLGARKPSLAGFMLEGIIPGYASLNAPLKLEALGWIRDHLDQAMSAMEQQGEDPADLLATLGRSPLISQRGGGLSSAEALYSPSAIDLVSAALGGTPAFPDMDVYVQNESRWLEFFARLGMATSPRPEDIDRYADSLAPGPAFRASASALLKHLDADWENVCLMELEPGESLLESLGAKAWLPALQSAEFPAFKTPSVEACTPSELYSRSVANLVCSQEPILACPTPRADLLRALGVKTIPPLETVADHLEEVVDWYHENPGEASKKRLGSALSVIYDTFGRLVNEEEDQASQRVESLRARFSDFPCLWDDEAGEFFLPHRVFKSSLADLMRPWAVAVAIDKQRQDDGYSVLGRRDVPSLADLAEYLDQRATEAGNRPVSEEEADSLVMLFQELSRLLELEPFEPAQLEVPVLTADRRLVEPRGVFRHDAHWLNSELNLGEGGIVHPGIPRALGTLMGVRRLSDVLEIAPDGEFVFSQNQRLVERCLELQELVRSEPLKQGIARLVHSERGYVRNAHRNWLRSLSLKPVGEFWVSYVVEISGVKRKVARGQAPFYFDGDANSVFLSECRLSLVEQFLAEALNQQLEEDAKLADLSQLVLVLREGDKVDEVLDDLRVPQLPSTEEPATPFEHHETKAQTLGDDVSPELEEEVVGGFLDHDDLENQDSGDDDVLVGESPGADRFESQPTAPSEAEDSRSGPSRRVDHPAGDALSEAEKTKCIVPANGSQATEVEGGNEDSGGVPRRHATRPDPRPLDPTTQAPVRGQTPDSDRLSVSAPGLLRDRTPPESQNASPEPRSPRSGSSRPRPRKSPKTSGARVLSMVCYPHQDATTIECDDFEPSGNERNEEIGRAGVEVVLDYERRQGREPTEMAHHNPGYDVVSKDEKGVVRRKIEVKSLAGGWGPRGVAIFRAQFNFGRSNPKRSWLYVVEYAEDRQRAVVWPIKNPMNQINQFRFDHMWRALAAQTPVNVQLQPRKGLWLTDSDGVRRKISRVMSGGGKLRLVWVEESDGSKARLLFKPNQMIVEASDQLEESVPSANSDQEDANG